MATIKNRKKEPLREGEIVSHFPQGLNLPTVIDHQAQRRVVDISQNPRLIVDPKNEQEMWWVDVASLFTESDNNLRDVKSEFADYPIKARGFVITLR